MGVFKSKLREKKRENVDDARDDGSDDDQKILYTSDADYDKKKLELLEKMFKRNKDEFILNNLLMSIMFFENDYSGRNESLQPDNSKMNVILSKEHQKSHLKPDAMPEEVNRNVRFKRRHGEKKGVSEPLLPQRIMIIYHNIGIDQEDEDNHYSDIDKPTFKAQIERAERKGYLKLKCINEEEMRKTSQNLIISDNANSTDDSKSYSNLNKDTTYVYADINDARTPKPLDIQTNKKQNLPKTFVREVKKKKTVYNKKREEIEIEYSEHYLISLELMRHFRKFGFQVELGKRLGFTEEDLRKSTYTNSGIFCKESWNNALWEIIPAVLISWPDVERHAFSRADRRTLIVDNIRYRWPAKYMLNEVQNQNCVVIPRGYFPKKGVNEENIYEWEIAFPQAERYLETKLLHVHIRAYLFLVTIYKTFIEPETERKGLLIEHIKNLIFWEVERDMISWPEEKLGTKLLRVIKNLNEALGKSQMQSYFIRERNLFENIPSSKLWMAQDVLHSIQQCPVMYFIAALRNLEYAHGDFYDFPDLDELCRYLINPGMLNINPKLYMMHHASSPVRERRLREEEKKKEKEKEQKENAKIATKNAKGKDVVEKPRVSTDSLNFRWTAKREMEESKETLILVFFLKHFLGMVRDSIAHKAYSQAKFYAKHCFYLEKLLERCHSDKPMFKYYKDQISNFEIEIDKKEMNSDNPPLTPARVSLRQSGEFRIKKETGVPDLIASTSYSSNRDREDTSSTTQKQIIGSTSKDYNKSPSKTQKNVVFNFDKITVAKIASNDSASDDSTSDGSARDSSASDGSASDGSASDDAASDDSDGSTEVIDKGESHQDSRLKNTEIKETTKIINQQSEINRTSRRHSVKFNEPNETSKALMSAVVTTFPTYDINTKTDESSKQKDKPVLTFIETNRTSKKLVETNEGSKTQSRLVTNEPGKKLIETNKSSHKHVTFSETNPFVNWTAANETASPSITFIEANMRHTSVEKEEVVLRKNANLPKRSKSLKFESKKLNNYRSSAPVVLRLNTNTEVSEI